ncbi:MAG: hypothetical protein ABW039_05980 [Sphingobium sp.]
MWYKVFAAAVLVGAPLVVLAVQNIVPPQPSSSPMPTEQVVVMPQAQPEPPIVMPPPSVPMPSAPAVAFDQPLPDAGKPMLAPGMGLPLDPAPTGTPADQPPAPPVNPILTDRYR